MSLMERVFTKIQKKPLRDKVRYALYRLRVQNDKLEDTMLMLQQKDRDMFQRCVACQLSAENARAEMFASECAEIRKMARLVLGSKIALERAILRLEDVDIFGDVLLEMTPVIGVVKETRGKIEGVIPEVANELHDVNEILDDVVLQTGEAIEPVTEVGPIDQEARRVLEESSVCAEEQIRTKFPEIPSFEHPTAIMESIGASEEIPHGDPLEAGSDESAGLDPPLLLNFIERCIPTGGVLNISECAEHFRVKREDVLKAVERLRSEGKIAT